MGCARLDLAGLLFLTACSGTPTTPDAAVPPGERIFSVGVADHSGGPPQAAPIVHLKLGTGTPSADTVVASRLAQPPTIDGDAAEWGEVAASTVPLKPPGMIVGLDKATWDQEWMAALQLTQTYDYGIPEVTIKAGYDDQRIYFLLQWADATEDRRREEWTFDGTTFIHSDKDEDRAYLGFDIQGSTPAFESKGCAGLCHVAENLGDTSTTGKFYRFKMHTNGASELADVWAWKATRSNPMKGADDQHWDNVSRKGDGPDDWSTDNEVIFDGGGEQPAMMGAGGINSSPDYIFVAGAGMPLAVPFDPTGATLGATLPGYIHQQASPRRAEVQAVGTWSAGQWTVEFSRALDTGDENDTQFSLP